MIKIDGARMNDEQKKVLLKLAADTIKAVVAGDKLPEFECDDAMLMEKRGCFVTIKNSGMLRGCIGQFVADRPLIEIVRAMAESSCCGDPRFRDNPITTDEFDELDIEISVLTPLKKTHDPLSLELGVDGIYITNGYASGCFLPQVATETGWSKEEFLSNCCSQKAGLGDDAWKDKDTEVYLFRCEIFNGDL